MKARAGEEELDLGDMGSSLPMSLGKRSAHLKQFLISDPRVEEIFLRPWIIRWPIGSAPCPKNDAEESLRSVVSG
jgi:hypothetical protein